MRCQATTESIGYSKDYGAGLLGYSAESMCAIGGWALNQAVEDWHLPSDMEIVQLCPF